MYLIPIAAILARIAGAGAWPRHTAELLFGIAITYPLHAYGIWAWVFAALWSFAWMETGHGTAFHMGQRPDIAIKGRKQFLSPVVDRICSLMNKPLGGSFYCWLFMGLKGLLIGLPLGLAGCALTVLWPLSYWIGRKVNNGALCELLSGACAGAVACLKFY